MTLYYDWNWLDPAASTVIPLRFDDGTAKRALTRLYRASHLGNAYNSHRTSCIDLIHLFLPVHPTYSRLMASSSSTGNSQAASTTTNAPRTKLPALAAYNNALVLLPPLEVARRLAPFRAVHDKAGTRWTSHVTFIFPFVEDRHLDTTLATLCGEVCQTKW